MSENPQVLIKKQRGRMRLTVLRKVGKYGPYYSALVYRNVKTGEDNGQPQFAETYWMDEQDVLHARRLLEIADDVIADAKQRDAEAVSNQEAA